jgi:hypothetical protein
MMKTTIAIGLVCLLLSRSVSAQQAAGPLTRQMQRGRTEVRIGLVLLGAGALVIPVTARGYVNGARAGTGVGLLALGRRSDLAWS